MKINFYLFVPFFLLIALQTYAQEADETFDYGTVKEGKYTNTFFALEVDIPQDWAVQSKEQMDRLHKMGSALVTGDDENLKALIKAADVNTAKLFMAYKYELGSAVEYNPSLSLTIENVKHAPGIKTGNEYLFQARRFLEKSQLKYTSIDEKFKKEVINGIDFYKMHAEITYMNVNISQIYYCTVLNGFSLIFVTSFNNKDDGKALKDLIHTVTIKK